MKTPQYQQPPLDPAFAQLMQQSQQDDINALQIRARDDSSSLLARYGAMSAMASSQGASAAGSPLLRTG